MNSLNRPSVGFSRHRVTADADSYGALRVRRIHLFGMDTLPSLAPTFLTQPEVADLLRATRWRCSFPIWSTLRVYYAVLALGGVVVPIHALLKAGEIGFVLEDSGARLLICAHSMLGEGAEGAATAGVEVITVGSPESSGAARRLETEAARAHPIFTYVARLPDESEPGKRWPPFSRAKRSRRRKPSPWARSTRWCPRTRCSSALSSERNSWACEQRSPSGPLSDPCISGPLCRSRRDSSSSTLSSS